jgi:hypothetical protein
MVVYIGESTVSPLSYIHIYIVPLQRSPPPPQLPSADTHTKQCEEHLGLKSPKNIDDLASTSSSVFFYCQGTPLAIAWLPENFWQADIVGSDLSSISGAPPPLPQPRPLPNPPPPPPPPEISGFRNIGMWSGCEARDAERYSDFNM